MRQGIMLATVYEPRFIKNWDFYYIQPKFNGHRCRAVVRDGQATLYSSEGNIITSVPHINQALSPHLSMHFDGELYHHGMPKQEIQSRVNRKSLHPDYQAIQYHIYDVVEPSIMQYKRVAAITAYRERCRNLPDCIQFAETSAIDITQPEKVEKLYQDYLEAGYEGIILRDPYALYEFKRSRGLLKMKPRHKATVIIFNAEEAISIDGIPMNTLGAFWCYLETNKHKVFKIGGGKLIHAERKKIWEEWKTTENFHLRQAEILYQELSTDGIPQQPILQRVL